MVIAENISVVIRTYTDDRWEYLVAAVNSVLSQTLLPMEIVLVVDHNPDLIEKALAQWSSSKVVVVENHRARGSSGAWNSGIDAALGDVIAFLDDDAVATPDWLAQLMSSYDREEVVGVGGAIKPDWVAGRPVWFPEEFDWVVGCTYCGLPEAIAPVRNLIGCNMSFRRKTLEEIGGFYEDKGLGHIGGRPIGCDETELCIRLRQRCPQAVLIYNPQAIVYHKVPTTRAQWSYFRSRCSLEGQSKAAVAHLVGIDDGLASERSYTFQTLPRGVLSGLTDTFCHRNLAGLRRAGAIVAGLAITALSCLAGTISMRLANRSAVDYEQKPIS